jgi:hypothetical protein
MATDLGKRVNKMINSIIQELFPGYTGMLGIREEAKTHDLGKLLLMGFDESIKDKRVRYEAKRKFELVKLLAAIESGLKKKNGTHDFFWGIMQKHVCLPEESTVRRWMISSHDSKDNYKCTDCRFTDKQPESLETNQVAEPLDSRAFEVTMPNGEKRKIRFLYDSREKDSEAMLLKWLRKPDKSLEQLLRDAYGVRAIFDTEEDLALFKQVLVERLQEPDPETGKVYDVKKQKKKNGVGKNGSDKPAISCDKFNLVIGGKDIELQLFTKEQYADYQTHRPNSWVEYKVRRFFDQSLSETFFPDSVYSNLPRKEIAEQESEKAFTDFWLKRKLLPKTKVAELREEMQQKLTQVAQDDTKQPKVIIKSVSAAPVN